MIRFFSGNQAALHDMNGDKKLLIFTQIGLFHTVTPVWIHRWLWLRNDAQSLMQQRRGALLFFKVIHKFQGHMGQKIADFNPNWVFPDCNCSF